MTRKLLASTLAIASTLPAFAVDAGQAAYTGGTSASIHAGTLSTLDLASTNTLIFHTTPGAPEIDIPYAAISTFQYSSDVAYHIGVLPAIAVSLVKRRERKHFFTITYIDAAKATQVAVFEVPKQQPEVLLPILRARAPQACAAQVARPTVPMPNCGGTLKH